MSLEGSRRPHIQLVAPWLCEQHGKSKERNMINSRGGVFAPSFPCPPPSSLLHTI